MAGHKSIHVTSRRLSIWNAGRRLFRRVVPKLGNNQIHYLDLSIISPLLKAHSRHSHYAALELTTRVAPLSRISLLSEAFRI